MSLLRANLTQAAGMRGAEVMLASNR